jgi:hypothetical protein
MHKVSDTLDIESISSIVNFKEEPEGTEKQICFKVNRKLLMNYFLSSLNETILLF